MKNRVIDLDGIKKYIPHRYPFLFVDRVLEVTDAGIKGLKNVTANEEFFSGHFPEYPVLPGVVIIEALAQVSGLYGLLLLEEEGSDEAKGKKTFFTSIDNVRFKRPVRPGDSLILESEYVKRKLGVWWFRCRATVDGEVACVAELSAAFR